MKQIIRKLEAMRNELDVLIKQLATETMEAVPSGRKGRPKTHIFHDWVDRQQLAQCIGQLHHCHFNQLSRLMEVEGEGYGETDFLLSVYCALIKLGLAPSLKHNQINKQYYSFLKDGCRIDLEDKERTFNNHLNKVVRTGYDLHCLNKESLSDHPLPGAMKPEEWELWQEMLAAAERLLMADSYLRTQDDYIGDYRNLKFLRRQLNIRLPKLLNVINNYGLFICDDFTFYSPKLNELMKPLEERRARIEAYKQKKIAAKLLEINGTYDVVSFDKEKGKGKGKGKVTSSSKEEDKGDDGGDVFIPETPAWERHVNALQDEEQWKEIMAMRSGLGQAFVRRFDEVLNLFKQHVQAVGNEKDILSPTDAKRYFCFSINPITFGISFVFIFTISANNPKEAREFSLNIENMTFIQV